MPITVLIADDQPVHRDGLASLLEPMPDIDEVGRAADGVAADEVVQAIRTLHDGGVVFGASLARRIAHVFAGGPHSAPAAAILTKLQARDRSAMIIRARDAGPGQSR
ncbi:MAG TPA: hypothetical protein VIT41_00600 [Microlunatus sp.]